MLESNNVISMWKTKTICRFRAEAKHDGGNGPLATDGDQLALHGTTAENLQKGFESKKVLYAKKLNCKFIHYGGQNAWTVYSFG